MSATGLDVFDTTLQKTHIWLDEIMGELECGRKHAWHVLGAVLRTIRDRIPLELGAHLGAQLPLLVRGAYYDQFQPGTVPVPMRGWDEFLALAIVGMIDLDPPIPPALAAEAVFAVISRHVSPGQVKNVQLALPEAVREHWLAAERVPEALT
ncbi:MAG: hypothetical protein JWN69_981 [Alphaproteobacteria bacterium]|nr:hypothetical protein [Alphaproteobacteria bacterium]